MKLTLLCNAGFALESNGAVLLVDAPNEERSPKPFGGMAEEQCQKILNREPPYDRVCGFWFTHDHPDHFSRTRMMEYRSRWPKVPIYLPDEMTRGGRAHMGPFVLEFGRIDHAPIPGAPPHVVTWIEAGEKTLYLPADAALDADAHRNFLRGRKADTAVWNSMYLSRPETRALMEDAAVKNLIYHMPPVRPDEVGLWRKLEMNFKRYPDELRTVTVLERYPMEIEL